MPRSTRWLQALRTATPTRRSRCWLPGSATVRAGRSRAESPRWPGSAPRRGGRRYAVRRARRRHGGTGDPGALAGARPSTGCSAPTARARTASPLEPAGRALARRAHRGDPLRRVVRRPAAAGHRQRLRARLYNGDIGVVVRLRGRPTRAVVPGPTASGVRHRAARRGRDDARDDHPQEPGLAGRPGHRAAAARGIAGC